MQSDPFAFAGVGGSVGGASSSMTGIGAPTMSQPAMIFPSTTPAAAPAPAPSPLAPAPAGGFSLPYSFVAYDNASLGLRVSLHCDKPQGRQSGQTEVTASFSNSSGEPMAHFVCQAAVPKFMKLTLLPASGDALPARGAPVMQLIRLDNSQQGAKAIALRLKLLWDGAPGGGITTDVRDFPVGL
jgi:hypothetical protein